MLERRDAVKATGSVLSFHDVDRRAVKPVLAVSTFDRPDYLAMLLESFCTTRDEALPWLVLVGDDGSELVSDECMQPLRAANVPYLLLRHGAWRIAALTNSLFDVAFSLDASVVFKSDDDVSFLNPGWDIAYLHAIGVSGFDHLVHFDHSWGDPLHLVREGVLESKTDVERAQGAFYSVTNRVFQEVGYLDELSFWGRGYAHVDFTNRCCLAGFNESSTLWDVSKSNDYLRLQAKSSYVPSINSGDPQIAFAVGENEKRRRSELIKRRRKAFLTFEQARRLREPPEIVASYLVGEETQQGLLESGLATRPMVKALPGARARVLNIRRDKGKWAGVQQQLQQAGVAAQRLPGHDGKQRVLADEWKSYSAQGLKTNLDRQLGRKAISSQGAWGYLSGARQAVLEAMSRRDSALLLFDDDVTLSHGFLTELDQAIGKLPPDWLLLYLGWTPRADRPCRRHDCGLTLSEGRCDGSFAVMISRAAFGFVLAACSTGEVPFDEALRVVDEAYPGRSFALDDPVVMPIVSASAIRESRSQIQFACAGSWSWSNFSGALTQRAIRERYNGPRETLLIQLREINQEVRYVAQELASTPFRNLEIIWVAPPTWDSSRHLRDLLRMDPRSFGVIQSQVGGRANQDVVDAFVETSGLWLEFNDVPHVLRTLKNPGNSLRKSFRDIARLGIGSVVCLSGSGKDPRVDGVEIVERVHERIGGVAEARSAWAFDQTLWTFAKGDWLSLAHDVDPLSFGKDAHKECSSGVAIHRQALRDLAEALRKSASERESLVHRLRELEAQIQGAPNKPDEGKGTPELGFMKVPASRLGEST